MLVVEKIRRNSKKHISYIYAKNTPRIFTADIPEFMEGTVLEQDMLGNWHAVGYETDNPKIASDLTSQDKFFYATKSFLSYEQYEEIYMTYNANAWEMFLQDPFFIADFAFHKGECAFPEIDKNINIPTFKQKLAEVKRAMKYIMDRETTRGNTWLSYAEFENQVSGLLSRNGHPLDKGDLTAYLNYFDTDFYFNKSGFNDNSIITDMTFFQQEKNIYDIIKLYENQKTIFPDYTPVSVSGFSERQNTAAKNLLLCDGRFSILTGGPGTGKTTLIKALVEGFLLSYPDKKVRLISPTGKAAKRLAEVMDTSMEAGASNVVRNHPIKVSTIHSFLGFYPDCSRDRINDIPDETKEKIEATDLLIIDEASMIDIFLFYNLIYYLDFRHTRVVLVGDINQLPSVGAGDLLRDLIYLGVHTEYLTENFRFIGAIAQNAAKINQKDASLITDENFNIITTQKEYVVSEALQLDADIFITPYQNTEYEGSVPVLNQAMQLKYLNGMPFVYGGAKYKINDAVIITRNNYNKKYDYRNGETGHIISYRKAAGRYGGEYCIEMDDGRSVCLRNEMEMDLGYAITIHKSQGSEYDHVCIILPEYSSFITKKMLYTAVTRAKEKVTIITAPGVLEKIIHNDTDTHRNTILKELTDGHIA